MASIFTAVDAALDMLNALTDPIAASQMATQPVMTFPLRDEHGRSATVWYSFNDGTWKGSVA